VRSALKSRRPHADKHGGRRHGGRRTHGSDMDRRHKLGVTGRLRDHLVTERGKKPVRSPGAVGGSLCLLSVSILYGRSDRTTGCRDCRCPRPLVDSHCGTTEPRNDGHLTLPVPAGTVRVWRMRNQWTRNPARASPGVPGEATTTREVLVPAHTEGTHPRRVGMPEVRCGVRPWDAVMHALRPERRRLMAIVKFRGVNVTGRTATPRNPK
jgi:hypothetical protein